MNKYGHVEDSEAGTTQDPPHPGSQPRFSSASQVPCPLSAKQQHGHCLAGLVTSSPPPAFAKPNPCPTHGAAMGLQSPGTTSTHGTLANQHLARVSIMPERGCRHATSQRRS